LKDALPGLLESICDAAPKLKWLRLMYAYPGAVSDRLIEVMAARPQILHYVDIPLQHGHPDVLKRMRRPANVDWVYRTLAKLRAAMPDLAIRTTFIGLSARPTPSSTRLQICYRSRLTASALHLALSRDAFADLPDPVRTG
jgi:hypothetical protein